MSILPKVNASAPNMPSRSQQDALIDAILEENGSPREAIRALLVINGALVDQLVSNGWQPPASFNIAGQSH